MNENRNKNGKKYVLIFIILGIFLRLLLCWYNPPENYFDDHFAPTLLFLAKGEIPHKDACLECFHPPVFYYASAVVYKIALSMGINEKKVIFKLLQFVNCFYSILTLGLIFLILNKLRLSDLSRTMALGTICFLPRHIYMSAIYSNDAMTYLFVSLCAYFLLISIEKKSSLFSLVALSISMTIAIFIKWNALVVIPMAAVTFALAFIYRIIVPRKKALISLIIVLIIPTVFFSIYMVKNINMYGTPLPLAAHFNEYDSYRQLRMNNGEIKFFNFTPWQYMKNPIISPGQVSSFWTLIYSGMWFDTEPAFLYFTDPNNEWWHSYFSALYMGQDFPTGDPLSFYTHLLGAVLIVLGLIPLILLIVGFCKSILRNFIWHSNSDATETIKIQIFTTLTLFSFIVVIVGAFICPVFSRMKATYVLNSISAFAVFIALGITHFEKYALISKIITVSFLLIFLFSMLHIIQIIHALSNLLMIIPYS
ncbi:MAG: hypothetical protein ABSB79_08250 [Syntrophales bacterium]|jgi:4-amino-4-deoxy-L-arabinose transferase-like glycosyltransferase